MNFKKTKWVIGIFFVGVGLAIILTTSLPKSLQYYVTVDEFVRDIEKFKNQEIKLAGKVAEGSIIKNNIEWQFVVTQADKKISVFYKGAMPDTFKDDADVVVTGKYENSVFVATHVLAKCASRYEEKLQPKLSPS